MRRKIRNWLKTKKIGAGSLVFFRSDTFNGKWVRFWTRSDWSHVGILIEICGELWLLEACSDNKKSIDFILEEPRRRGVQLVKFVDKIIHCTHAIGIRRMIPYLNPLLNTSLFDQYKKHHDTEFTTNKMEFIFAWYDGPCGMNKQNDETMFCSKLVAECLYSLCLLDRKTGEPSNEYTQKDLETIQLTNPKCRSIKYKYDNKIITVKKK